MDELELLVVTAVGATDAMDPEEGADEALFG